jgi:hypothetical protein
MCWTCHQGLSDEVIHEELTNALDEPNFELWNDCSVSHLLIIGNGYNGEDNKSKANTLLDMYMRYLLSKGKIFRWSKLKIWQTTFKLPTEIPSPV